MLLYKSYRKESLSAALILPPGNVLRINVGLLASDVDETSACSQSILNNPRYR